MKPGDRVSVEALRARLTQAEEQGLHYLLAHPGRVGRTTMTLPDVHPPDSDMLTEHELDALVTFYARERAADTAARLTKPSLPAPPFFLPHPVATGPTYANLSNAQRTLCMSNLDPLRLPASTYVRRIEHDDEPPTETDPA